MTNQKIQSTLIIAWATSALLLLLSLNAILSDSKPSDEQVERELYCEMTELYKSTGGQYGWPSYKGEC